MSYSQQLILVLHTERFSSTSFLFPISFPLSKIDTTSKSKSIQFHSPSICNQSFFSPHHSKTQKLLRISSTFLSHCFNWRWSQWVGIFGSKINGFVVWPAIIVNSGIVMSDTVNIEIQ